jgi:hypothetical protein
MREGAMNKSRVLDIIRHFRENGLKVLLQQPGNLRDLVTLTGTPLREGMEFARLEVDPTTYVASDYRHLASDLVVKVPFRMDGGRRRTITLYILVEHLCG